MGAKRNYRRHNALYHAIRPLVRLYLWMAYRFRAPQKVRDDGPFLMICNHVTDLDMLFTACTFRHHMYYVASEHVLRFGRLSRLLNFVFCPIIRKKGTVAAATAMEMKRLVKQGYSIGLFAEGERSSSGVNRPVIPSTGSLARMLNCRMYTVRLHGGYFSSPRWGKGIRRGRLTSEIVGCYEPADLRAMTAEEVTALIDRDIYVDAYADNEKDHIAFRGKKPAEGIQHVLLACPSCGNLNTITSKGSGFSCPCGMHGTYDAYGMLHGTGFSFSTITAWAEWTRKTVASLPDCPSDAVLCRDPDQILREILPDHTVRLVDSGELVLTRDCLYVGTTAFPLEEIATCDLIAHGYLLINRKDGRYFEIRNRDRLFSGQLYLYLIDRYHPGIANL